MKFLAGKQFLPGWEPLVLKMRPSLSSAAFCWPNSLFALSFPSSAWHARVCTPSDVGLWWTERSCSDEASSPELPIKREAC